MSGFTFDQRTRTASDVTPTTIDQFHLDELPALMDQNGALATRAFAASNLETIALSVDGSTYTWALNEQSELTIAAGDSGEGPLVALSAEWFEDIVNDVRSTVALMIGEDYEMVRGNIVKVINWEQTLRALTDQRPAYEDGLISFVDQSGNSLDLSRKFTLTDDPSEMRHFLSEAGFLHITGVYSQFEVDQLSEQTDEWRSKMTPEDRRAWYARVGDEQVCVRVTGLGADDVDLDIKDRLAPIGAVTGEPYEYVGTDLLVKPVGVDEGISDLPWHKDCALGMHSYDCASITCGISITSSDEKNGRLGVVAGSHRANLPLFDFSGEIELPELFLSADAGDVTVHLSCTLHCATPPQHSERRVSYSSFKLPGEESALGQKVRNVRDQAGRSTYAPS